MEMEYLPNIETFILIALGFQANTIPPERPTDGTNSHLQPKGKRFAFSTNTLSLIFVSCNMTKSALDNFNNNFKLPWASRLHRPLAFHVKNLDMDNPLPLELIIT
ncbi:hypothetical protein FRX31_006406 [Thalictrum thalictroides]|uniref:Uncharacterized protein n=1 Tax=Thalictrum thalictroides TaxID=46969 RepID=A0A7J6X584_THATH|nr:hypothetical protein FRX31_006406 [Thalictrum thalictroides]